MHSYFFGTTDSLCVTVQFVEFIPQSFSVTQNPVSISLLIKDLLVCDLSLLNEATAELSLFKIFDIIKRIIYFKVLGTKKFMVTIKFNYLNFFF